MTHRTTSFRALPPLLIALLTACGGGEGAADSNEQVATEVPEPMFDESADEDDCAILTLADVSGVTGIAESAIEQQTVSGCLYEWEGGILSLWSTRVHDSLDRARRYFDRFTSDVAAEDAAEAKERVRSDLADESELNAQGRAVGGAMVDAMKETDIRHRSLSGIGSEAVVDTRGSLYIRYGNMTLTVGSKDADGNDTFDPGMARAVGERIIANLDAM